MDARPFLSVCMITYNHENFIKQSIEGIVLQKLSYNLELIICDDASTDSTNTIIKDCVASYSGDIKIRYISHSKNLGMYSNFKFALQQCQGQYIAICEGDDYWTDPLKLQKQVDFLETNPDFCICWTRYKILSDGVINAPTWEATLMNESTDYHEVTYNNFASPYCTYALTSVFKSECLNNSLDLGKFRYFKDNTLYCLCLKYGRGAVLNFNSAMYRIQSTGTYSLASGYDRAIANYMSYNEIGRYIPDSRVPNIYLKYKIWKQTFREEIERQSFSSFKKTMMKLKLYFNLKP